MFFTFTPPQTGAMLHILKYLTRGAGIFFLQAVIVFFHVLFKSLILEAEKGWGK